MSFPLLRIVMMDGYFSMFFTIENYIDFRLEGWIEDYGPRSLSTLWIPIGNKV